MGPTIIMPSTSEFSIQPTPGRTPSASLERTRRPKTASHSPAGTLLDSFSNASHDLCGVSDRSQSRALLGTSISRTASPLPSPSSPD